MRSIVVEQAGGPEVLVVREAARPVPQAGQVLVRVAAAGVNYADVMMRGGRTAAPFPLTPGVEGAGTVEEVGPEVSGVAAGDRVAWSPVAGAGGWGSYAEYACVAAAQLMPVPDDIGLRTAATVILQGLTAHYLANEQYPVGPGTTVLVHAAAGGTGQTAVRWLKHLGATVVGTVSTDEKAALARAAGVDHVIRYEEFAKAARELTDGQGVHYIVDGVGGSTFRADLDAVRPRGHICVFGQAGGVPAPFSPMELIPKSVTVAGGYMTNFLRTRDEVLGKADAVWAGVREGWLAPDPATAFPLDAAADAHARLEGRASTGKLVLTVSPEAD
ncbi:quinone oxidoreductase [Streptomycetaceae bacterium NBC_01309]